MALGLLGAALGAGGTVLTVSYVQAEGGSSGVYEVIQQDYRRREATRRPAQQQVYYAPAAYAPARNLALPLFQTNSDGRLAAPAINLNPFMPKSATRSARKKAKAKSLANQVALDTVSGAANVTRTICVRVCDGFHAPIGYLGSNADLPAHEALCKASNPGVPVKIYRVPAGAQTIDDAIGPDGKTYGVLPMAFSHEKSADPACRPKIVQRSERRVSIFKDFTLRPGDSVVVEGSARVFNGAQRYPYRAGDFSDFRASEQLSGDQRRKIDQTIGHSFTVAAERSARRAVRLKEANLAQGRNRASDMLYSLRGPVAASEDVAFYAEGRSGRVRVISPDYFGAR